MSESISQNKLDAAVEFGFLSKVQVESLENERRESNYSVLEIAIRKGMLDRKQLDILNIFAEPESLVPGYRIDGFLGEGGVGTVYKATQIRMDRPVAIKTIHRSAARNDLTLKRFEQEARIVGQLRHPNIVPAFDFGLHKEKLYLIMEFVDGIDAEKHLLQKKRFAERHAWFIARQVCHALDNAKQLGIIHRDIKPGNLILTEPPAGTPMPTGVPFVKVADFGLAKFSDQKMDAKLTLEQAVSGTPFYMSPEQIQSLELDHRSDIYSLGATIWHLISGAPPVTGKGPLDVITNKMKLEDSWLELTGDMSHQGFQLLEKMCRHDRDQRIDNYTELSREIDAVIDSLDGLEPQENLTPESFANSSPLATITSIRELAKTFVQDGAGNSDDSQDFVLADKDNASDSYASAENFAAMDDAGRTQDSMPNIGDDKQSKQQWHPPALWAVVLSCGLVLAAAAYLFVNTSEIANSESGSKNDTSIRDASTKQPRIRLSKFAGLPIYLFSGTQVDLSQRFSGTWEPAKGGEDGNEGVVLSGLGTRNFQCRDSNGEPLRNFRFVCGFRHHKADLIEFRLINEESQDDDEEEFFRVVIKPDMAKLIGGEKLMECEIQQFDTEESFGPHQFRIESQPKYWRVEVDRELLGEIDKPEGYVGDDAIIQLSIKGKGNAHFDGISLQKFADQSEGK